MVDIRAMVAAKAKEPLVVSVEGLGDVLFLPISIMELKETESTIPDAEERGYYLLWKMLNGAYPELTLNEMKNWPVHITNRISEAIFDKLDFRAKGSPKPSI